MKAIERTEGRYDVWEKELGEVRRWRSPERVVLECGCRVRLVLDGHASFWHEGNGVSKCGFCGARFILVR